MDYASHQSSLNHKMASVDDDGWVRYVISNTDSGIQNWLDASGYSEGSFFARWTYCEKYPTGIESQLVKLNTLNSILPVDTMRVTKQERAATISRRQEAISRRYAGGS